MRILEWKIWGGNRSENDAMYIWASDAYIALQIARTKDRNLDATQWTGREKEIKHEEKNGNVLQSGRKEGRD